MGHVFFPVYLCNVGKTCVSPIIRTNKNIRFPHAKTVMGHGAAASSVREKIAVAKACIM